MVREIDLTRDAPKTHQDRDKRDRIERLRERLKSGERVDNVLKGILDLLADEL